MPTKSELEQRIRELKAEVHKLKSQKPADEGITARNEAMWREWIADEKLTQKAVGSKYGLSQGRTNQIFWRFFRALRAYGPQDNCCYRHGFTPVPLSYDFYGREFICRECKAAPTPSQHLEHVLSFYENRYGIRLTLTS